MNETIRATKSRQTKNLLRLFAKNTARTPEYIASSRELYVRFEIRKNVAVYEDLPAAWRDPTTHPEYDCKADETDSGRSLVFRVRKELRKYNSTAMHDVVVYFPEEIREDTTSYAEDDSSQNGRYWLDFWPRREWLKRLEKDRRKKKENGTSSPPAAPFSEERVLPMAFWSKLVEPIALTSAHLIYSNEFPRNDHDEIRASGSIKTPIAKAAPEDQVYTGTGETAAALKIGLRSAHLDIELSPEVSGKFRSKELDIPNSWFVLLGSSATNKSIRQLRDKSPWEELQNYRFEVDEEAPKKQRVYLLKTKIKEFRRVYINGTDPESGTEYALISYLVCKRKSQIVLALTGMTTAGTRAAAEFICMTEHLQTLIKTLGLDLSKELPSFEVVLEVKIADSMPDVIKIHGEEFVVHNA